MNRKSVLRAMAMTLVAATSVLATSMGVAVAKSWPSNVSVVDGKRGGVVEVKGDLASGKTMALDWASKSNVACFPATINDRFEGNHVLYATQLPSNSEMTITVIPDDKTTDVSLYAYSIGSTDTSSVVPSLSLCTSCESSPPATRPHNPGGSETVKLTAIRNPYNVVIGVAGVRGTKTGTYKLKVEIKPR
jgi:hypothetical protein